MQYRGMCVGAGLKRYTENKQYMKKHSTWTKYMFPRLCSNSWSKIIYQRYHYTLPMGRGRRLLSWAVVELTFWWTKCTMRTLVESADPYQRRPCAHEAPVFTPSLPRPTPWIWHYKYSLHPESPFSKHSGFGASCTKASNGKSVLPMPTQP